MKKFPSVLVFLMCIFIATTLFASQKELQWGGLGYDPTLKENKDYKYSRYTARVKYNYNQNYFDESIIEILVDARETVGEVGRIDLMTSKGDVVSSKACWKAMKHITAPWVCSFEKSELENLSGIGQIKTFNKSERILLEEKVDFEALKEFFIARF